MTVKIKEYRDILLDDLVIGKAQVRTQDPGKDIEELCRSIEVQGLLQPIVVCPAENRLNKWEILTGQRRFLAHKMLGRDSISAAILDKRVNEGEAKAISITENLIRRKLSGKELIDGIMFLYNIYGNIKVVAETTGLSESVVRDNVKYPRLIPELKELVDDGNIEINVALKAQDSATNYDSGTLDPETAISLAKEMQPMTGPQRKNVVKERKNNPEKPIDDVIESAKTGGKVIQVIATVTQDTHTAIQKFASAENTTQDDAVGELIERALIEGGFLEK